MHKTNNFIKHSVYLLAVIKPTYNIHTTPEQMLKCSHERNLSNCICPILGSFLYTQPFFRSGVPNHMSMPLPYSMSLSLELISLCNIIVVMYLCQPIYVSSTATYILMHWIWFMSMSHRHTQNIISVQMHHWNVWQIHK